jgi:elongation factor P
MLATSDFRKNATKILFRDEPWLVIDFSHVKPGKGGAFVRTKMRNLKNGAVLEETFRSGEKFDQPDLSRVSMQYLYVDGDQHNFMDQENYEQLSFAKAQLGDAAKYLKESSFYDVLFFEGVPLSIDPPMFMELLVTEAMPGVKGDTAQGGGSKPVTLETGLKIQVPLFIEEGDILKIDTREDKYIERVKG